MLQNITLGGLMIALPIYFQMVFEYNAMQTGLAIAPFSLSIFAMAVIAGRKLSGRRPSRLILSGFAFAAIGLIVLIPLVPRATSGMAFLLPLLVIGSGVGLLVSQLNNYTLAPIDEEHISEAAGVNSASGSFGLSFGLAFAGAIMLAALAVSFMNMSQASTVLTPAQQDQVAIALENLQFTAVTRRRLDELDQLLEFSRRLGILDPIDIVRTLTQSVQQVIHTADTVLVSLWEPEQDCLVPKAAAGYHDDTRLLQSTFRAGQSLPMRVYQSGEVLRIAEVSFTQDYNLSPEHLLVYRDATGWVGWQARSAL